MYFVHFDLNLNRKLADLSSQHKRCYLTAGHRHMRGCRSSCSKCDVTEWIFQVMGSTVIGSARGFKLFEVSDAQHCGNTHMHINILHVTS